MKYIVLILLIASTSYGALPPAWQDVKELQAILEDKDLNQYLNSADSIEEIHKNESGWAIITNHGEVRVEVKYISQPIPGPQKFKLNFFKL